MHSYLRSEAASERVDLALRLCAVSCGSADGADAAGHPGLPGYIQDISACLDTARGVVAYCQGTAVLASSQQQVRANRRRGLTVVYQYGTVQVQYSYCCLAGPPGWTGRNRDAAREHQSVAVRVFVFYLICGQQVRGTAGSGSLSHCHGILCRLNYWRIRITSREDPKNHDNVMQGAQRSALQFSCFLNDQCSLTSVQAASPDSPYLRLILGVFPGRLFRLLLGFHP